MIALIAVTAPGRALAARVAATWPDCEVFEGPAAAALQAAWSRAEAVVCFLATGAVVRLAAPLLTGKHADPGVVCVDDAGRFAIALLGGHAGGANRLAARLAELLGATPVITTGSDVLAVTSLDALAAAGFAVDGDRAAVGAALLSGEPVPIAADATWPLPPLPTVPAGPGGGARITVTDRAVHPLPGNVVVRPPSLLVGVGASRGAPPAEVRALLADTLRSADLAAASVAGLATVAAKADEPALLELAGQLQVPLTVFPAEQLAAVEVPHPSEVVRAAVGTASVAEAAALTAAGPGGILVVAKTASATATVAVARRPPRGRLALVGLGPGSRDLLPERARAELARASVVVGLATYLDQIRDLLRPGTRILSSGLGAEQARARDAVEQARAGHAVALVGGGDAGVYAMASPALDLLDGPAGGGVDVVAVPGITAALAAAALLGAPLGHDAATVSLSDLHTSWQDICRRVRAATEGDFVVTFYNPRSQSRHWQLDAALDLLRGGRPGTTPVGIVHRADRPGQQVVLTTLADVDVSAVDMSTVVVVGSSRTRMVGGRMVTPRDYRWAG